MTENNSEWPIVSHGNVIKLPVAQVGRIRTRRWQSLRRWWYRRQDMKHALRVARIEYRCELATCGYMAAKSTNTLRVQGLRRREGELGCLLRHVERVAKIRKGYRDAR